MRKILFFIVIIFSLTATYGYAVQPKKHSEKNAYQKELKKIEKENPQDYEDMKINANFTAELVLATLGYGIGPFDGRLDEKKKNALKNYQRKRNIPETGDPLSFETLNQLLDDMKIIDYQPVILPGLSVFTDLWNKGYVSASGTWVLLNDKMAWPEQTSEISCDRHANICMVATAILSGTNGDRVLSVDVEKYEIERWDEHELSTKPLPTTLGCVRYVLRINRLQKAVTAIRSTISNDGTCKNVEQKEIHMKLTDGFTVHWNLLQERNKKFRQLLNITPTLFQYLESKSYEKSK